MLQSNSRLHMFSILNRYIARKYFFTLIFVIITISSLIFLFDLVEQIRIYSSRGIPLKNVFALSFYRTFYLIQKTNAYAVLLAGIITYQLLTKNSELIIMRASGVSILSFLLPSVCVVVAFGFILTTIINPLSSKMIYEYEKTEAHYKKGSVSVLSLSKTGLWMKDNINEQEERIIHALRLSENEQELYDVTFIFLTIKVLFLKGMISKKLSFKV